MTSAASAPPVLVPDAASGAPPILFRGWLVVAGAFTVMMVGYGAAYSYAAFAADLATSFGASRSAISLVYGLCGFTAFTVSAVSGLLADRIGPRLPAIAGMVLVGLGLVSAAAAQTLTQLYLCYGLLIGLGVGLAYVPAIAAVQRWFVAWRGLASGIAAAGIGVGTALVPLAARILAPIGDWHEAFAICGVLAMAVGVAGAMLLSPSPERAGLRPDGAQEWRIAPPVEGAATRTVIRGAPFRLLWLGTMLVSVPVSLPFAHLAHSAMGLGMAAADALSLLTVLGLASIAGRCVLGVVADEIGRGITFLGCCAGVALATLFWALSSGFVALTAFAILFGATYGGFVALLPAYAVDCFGRRSAAGVIGVLYTGRGVALLGAAPAIALLADVTGGYGWPLALSAALGALGTLLIAAARIR